MRDIMDVPFPRAFWRFLISFLTLNISIFGEFVCEDFRMFGCFGCLDLLIPFG